MNGNIINLSGQKISNKFAHLDPKKGLGAGVVAGGFPVLSYKQKNWSLKYQGNRYTFTRPDDGTALSYIDVIIVACPDYISKTYYPNAYSENSTDPPVCSSVKGDKPDPGVPEPQSKSCPSCRHYGWTMLANGRRSKPCQDSQRMAVLLMPAVTKRMLGSPLLEPVYLKIPPASLGPLKSYGEALQHESIPFPSIVTRIAFTPDDWSMVFTTTQALSDREADMVLPLIEDPRTKRITGETPDIREVPQVPSPPPVKKIERIETGLEEAFEPPPPPAAAAVFDDDEEVEIISPPAPAKRRGRPPKAALEVIKEPAPDTEEDEPPPSAARAAFNDEGDIDDADVASVLDLKIGAMLPK